MTDKSSCHGDDTLPLGIQEPSEREIEHARRVMRQIFLAARPASGTICGLLVEDLTDLDKVLAFDWLWMRLSEAMHRSGDLVRPL